MILPKIYDLVDLLYYCKALYCYFE